MGFLIDDFEIEQSEGFSLDQFSTSPTRYQDLCSVSPAALCSFGAPFFAFKREGLRYGVTQGCCNHWECPRCGQQVARRHYGRIVEGIRKLSENGKIWFVTITCRGADLSEKDATLNYLKWTSKLLDACYADAKRKGKDWHYVQVTEKQKRGHPHSHILTTWCPDDVHLGHATKWSTGNDKYPVPERILALRSDWLQARVVASGLGEQYDISSVEAVEGAARYVAKYCFKPAQFQAHYPKGWKRVRYSGKFPKLPKIKSDAFVLLSGDDWRHLASVAAVVDAETGEAYESACFYLHSSDTIVHERKVDHDASERGANHRKGSIDGLGKSLPPAKDGARHRKHPTPRGKV